MSLNNVVLMGRLTADIEVKYTKSGKSVANFDIALSERIKQGEEWVENTLFFPVTVWGKQAENLAEYMGKGDSVVIMGRLSYDTWEDQSGKKNRKDKIIATVIQFGAKKGEGFSKSNNKVSSRDNGTKTSAKATVEHSEEDVPF